jgi:hypothetical protein
VYLLDLLSSSSLRSFAFCPSAWTALRWHLLRRNLIPSYRLPCFAALLRPSTVRASTSAGYLSQYSSFFPSNYGACVLHAKIGNPSAIRQCNFYCQLRGCLYPVHITKLNDSGTICSGRWITYKHTRTSAFILSLMCQTLDPRPRTKIDSPTKKFTIRETFDLGTHTVSLRARDAHLT